MSVRQNKFLESHFHGIGNKEIYIFSVLYESRLFKDYVLHRSEEEVSTNNHTLLHEGSMYLIN